MFEGILPIYKERGITSHDVVFKARKILQMKKIGHSGTLDPEVDGVLLLLLGGATKVSDYAMDLGKSYRAEVCLGLKTTTEDFTGEVIEECKVNDININEIKEILSSMIGEIEQTPPIYSAIKVNGRKLYEYARRGQFDVEIPTRKVNIYDISFIENSEYYKDDKFYFSIDISCGKGTYVRTIATSIGEKLNLPSTMSKLTRTRSGEITLEKCLKLSEIEQKVQEGNLEQSLLRKEYALEEFQFVEIPKFRAKQVMNGLRFRRNQFPDYDFTEIKEENKKRVAALGFFDGIHKAHQKIIGSAVEAAEKGFISAVITLDKSPKEYFGKTSEESLTPTNKKNELLKNLGVDEVYYLEFNEKLQNLSAEEFINNILKKLNVDKVFCGFDYRFGFKGLGTPDLIRDSGIEVIVLEKEKIDQEKISTTVLKEFVRKGEFSKYNEYTGRFYSISGLVVKGRQLGRTINFPTANLELDGKYLLPETNGVYITKIKVNNKIYKSVTNIGYNPTVSDEKNKKFIETHILDFNEDIYGEKIEIYFYEFLRKEQKFESFDHLKEQLKLDKKTCEEKDY